jgi:hypothetical protein
LREGPEAEAQLNQLVFFVRLKPHAPSEKATTGFVIKLKASLRPALFWFLRSVESPSEYVITEP